MNSTISSPTTIPSVIAIGIFSPECLNRISILPRPAPVGLASLVVNQLMSPTPVGLEVSLHDNGSPRHIISHVVNHVVNNINIFFNTDIHIYNNGNDSGNGNGFDDQASLINQNADGSDDDGINNNGNNNVNGAEEGVNVESEDGYGVDDDNEMDEELNQELHEENSDEDSSNNDGRGNHYHQHFHYHHYHHHHHHYRYNQNSHIYNNSNLNNNHIHNENNNFNNYNNSNNDEENNNNYYRNHFSGLTHDNNNRDGDGNNNTINGQFGHQLRQIYAPRPTCRPQVTRPVGYYAALDAIDCRVPLEVNRVARSITSLAIPHHPRHPDSMYSEIVGVGEWLNLYHRAKRPPTHYRLMRKMGEGTFGIVREAVAYDGGSPRNVVLKFFKNKLCNGVDVSHREAKWEYSCHERVSSSAFISTVYGLFTEHALGGRSVLVVEPGNGTLRQEIDQLGGRISEIDAMFYMRQLASAIKFINDKNMVHRDIKPENIILCGTGGESAKVIDFGLTAELQRNGIREEAGTLYYMAPEILNGRPYGKKVDAFSLGVMLFEMLTGGLPFKNVGEAMSKEEVYIEDIGVSRDAKDVIRGLLRKNPRCRYTMVQVLQHPWMDIIR